MYRERRQGLHRVTGVLREIREDMALDLRS